MAQAAYELRAGVKEFSGGSVALPNGEAFDVGAALESGGGKIVLETEPSSDSEKERERAYRDDQIAGALEGYPALKRTSAGDTEPLDDEAVKAATKGRK